MPLFYQLSQGRIIPTHFRPPAPAVFTIAIQFSGCGRSDAGAIPAASTESHLQLVASGYLYWRCVACQFARDAGSNPPLSIVMLQVSFSVNNWLSPGSRRVSRGSRRGLAGVSPGSRRGLAGVSPGSRRGLAGVSPGSRRGLARVSPGSRPGSDLISSFKNLKLGLTPRMTPRRSDSEEV